MARRRAVFPLVVLALGMPRTAPAQTPAAADPAPRLSASIVVGTFSLTDLQTQPVRAERLGEGGDVAESALLVRTVTGESGRSASVAVVIGVSPAWALRLGGGVARARLDHAFAGPVPWAAEARQVPVAESPDVNILTWDAALRFRIHTEQALRPYVELGIAAERWTASAGLPGGAGGIDALMRIGGQAAVGGDYPLSQRLALSLKATSRVFRTPLAPVVGGAEVGRTDTLVLTAEAPDAGLFADMAVEMVRQLRLDLGISYRPGAAVAVRPDRSVSDDSTSALRR